MNKWNKILLLAVSLVLLLGAIFAITALATASDDTVTDAMTAIRADETLEGKLVETKSLTSDGYIGIPIDFYVYYDQTKGEVDPGTWGTTLIMYVLNTRAERTGTDSDVSIIRSMLERGYIVMVTDYKNHEKAISPDLEWSTQHVLQSVRGGKYFTSDIFPKNTTYRESFVVPAGYDLSRDHVYWEFDKHAVDGTLEEIVNVWNLDFRGTKGENIIPWVHEDGTPKATQNGFDGSAPVWYSLGTGDGEVTSNGKTFVPDAENGTYIKVKHTKAEEITDCVKIDGTPIDLNLYMHIIYPTNPEKTVPVLALASSSEHLASAACSNGRPHTTAFGFNGYALALYDYGYVPMSRVDHYGYFDGSGTVSGSVTGENMTYSLYTYNSGYSPTAAMRYLRYLGLSDSETYAFNGTIGTIGNSKGSMITHLADKDLAHVKTLSDGYTEEELLTYAQNYIGSFPQYYYLTNYDGSTRYEVGAQTYTKDGFQIDGGELQPWLTYNGSMIPSDAQFVYSCCGTTTGMIDENYAAIYTSAHTGPETSAFGAQNTLANLCRIYDIPSAWYEVVLGHTFVARENNDYGIDPYVAFFDFANYILNDAAVSVSYVSPLAGSPITATSPITIKFAGIVSESEIAKVTLTDPDGAVVLGTFESAYGRTEWTFTPTAALKPDTAYTLTIPETLLGENGVAIREGLSATFYTEKGNMTDLGVTENTTVTDQDGAYYTITVPDLTAYSAEGANRIELRVRVTNDAANTLVVYAVDSADAAEGEELGSVPLRGTGFYTVDLTDALTSRTAGEEMILLVKAKKTAGTFDHKNSIFAGTEDFEDGAHSFKVNSRVTAAIEEVDAEHGKSISLYVTPRPRDCDYSYYMSTQALSYYSFILHTVTEEDYGRTFTITFDVYDTVSRYIHMSTNSLTNLSTGIIDYDRNYMNYRTEAGKWTTVSFDVTISTPDYGLNGLVRQNFFINVDPTGNTEQKIYFDNFSIQENVTEVTYSSATLAVASAGGSAYKAPVSDTPFLVGDVGYATLPEAVAALGTESVITLQANVTLTDSDVIKTLPVADFTLDLNGYSIRTDTKSNAVISLGNTADETVAVTLKNGSVYLSKTSLFGLSGATGTTLISATLENVHVGTEDGAMVSSVLVSIKDVTATVDMSLALTDCTVDLRCERYTKNPVVFIPSSTDTVTVSAVVTGGVVTLSRVDKAIFTDLTKTAFYKKNESGAYTQFLLPTAREMLVDYSTVISEDGFCTLAASDNACAAGYISYVPTASELSTPYGMIPEKYSDVDAYPLVLFNLDTNAFIFASNIFLHDNNSSAIVNKMFHTTGGNYVIYLRRDYTYEPTAGFYNVAFIGSDVMIDLGGHTLTHTSGIMFSAQAKKPSYTTNIYFKNGEIVTANGNALIQFSALTQYQIINFSFEDITFSIGADTTAPAYWISNTSKSSNNSSGTAPAFESSITLTNCVFDMTNVTSAVTLFGIGHNKGLVAETIQVYGGSILGSASNLTFSTFYNSENCTISFEPGEDGNYITNTRLTTDATPKASVIIDNNVMIFNQAVSTSGDYTTYALGIDPMSTPYGTIPDEYASAEDYPILVFNTNTKTCVLATSVLNSQDKTAAMGYISAKLGGNYAVYLRNNVATDGIDWNFGKCVGNIIFDLNGYTISLGAHGFWALSKTTIADALLNVTVKNGTIEVNNYTLLSFSGQTGENMEINYTFENVTFKNLSGASSVLVNDGTKEEVSIKGSAAFVNCTFEISSGCTGALVRLGSTSGTVAMDVTFTGGKFIYEAAKMSPIYAIKEGVENKSVTFLPNDDGKYTTVQTAKSSNTYTGTEYQTGSGVRYLLLEMSDDTYSYYSLGIKHEYGYIKESYLDAEAYPILVFNLDTGAVVYTTDILTGEGKVGAALGWVSDKKGGNYAILLQRDYICAADSKVNYQLGIGAGTTILDLGGHSLTLAAGSLLHLQPKTTGALTYIVKNGTIHMNGQSLAYIACNATGVGKVIDLTLENITFLEITKTLMNEANAITNACTINITFKNCGFEVSSSFNSYLINVGQSTSSIALSVDFVGGSFTFAGKKINLFYTRGVENKIITFSKEEGGSYPKLTVPASVDLSANLYESKAGKTVGTRLISKTDTTSTYQMSSLSIVSVYLNLTNDINVVYRVYLPSTYQNPVMTFVIDGMTVTVSDYTIDENGLYCFTLKAIGPHKMGDEITATLTASEGDVTDTVTKGGVSVSSYAEGILALYPDDEALAALIEKLLVYGAASQMYKNHNTDSLVAEIPSLSDIPESENTMTLTGTASDIASFTACGLYLDGAFELRVSIKAADTEGLTLEATKDGVTTVYELSELTGTDGVYTVYYDGITATELDTSVTFVIKQNGSQVGKTLTYSANSYLYRMQSTTDANLATLIKALYAYGVEAEAYASK